MKAKKKPSVADLVAEKRSPKGAKEDAALIEHLQAEVARLRRTKSVVTKPVKANRGKAAKHITRVVIPDSHGNHIDPQARAAFLADLKDICPDEIVWLGDHLDCGGTFSTHQRNYTHELVESYNDDVDAANAFLDDVQAIAPNARNDYIFGNHESHVERWVARTFTSYKDASMMLGLIGPEGVLRLKQREYRVIKSAEFYDGLAIPGTIRKDRIFYTHGVSHAKHADSVHLERFAASVVFGHVHRSMSVVSRTVTSHGHGAFCPGTLAKLQPSYLHTHPSSWSHGYGLEFINASTGTYVHINVPIMDGVSMLAALTSIGRSA